MPCATEAGRVEQSEAKEIVNTPDALRRITEVKIELKGIARDLKGMGDMPFDVVCGESILEGTVHPRFPF
jgi:hypothetical protein